jgi:ribose 5-phosphate isomerase RpiB
MIYSARQLEDLHRANGHVTLPYNARLTPLAQDWARARKLEIHYSDGEARETASGAGAASLAFSGKSGSGTFLWWCDGPCGPAKAAIAQQAKQSNLLSIEIGSDLSQLASVVKHVAAEVKAQRAAGAVLLVACGAGAMVYANRCPSLRAVLGTCLDSVDQALRRVAANVLVVEHAHKTLSETRNMLARFVSASRELSPDVRRQLEELASCG